MQIVVVLWPYQHLSSTCPFSRILECQILHSNYRNQTSFVPIAVLSRSDTSLLPRLPGLVMSFGDFVNKLHSTYKTHPGEA